MGYCREEERNECVETDDMRQVYLIGTSKTKGTGVFTGFARGIKKAQGKLNSRVPLSLARWTMYENPFLCWTGLAW